MSEHPNAAILRSLYDNFTSGDIEGALAVFSDDAVWHTAGNNPTSGDVRGRQQIGESMGKTMELSGGTFAPELHDIAASDEHAVFIGSIKGQRAGKTMDEQMSLVVHVKDGKLTEVWEYAFNQQAVDDFWS